jgi:hypothetical protein
MQRFRAIPLIVTALLAMLASQPALASSVAWLCEGRVCGVWLCCCEQPEGTQADARCRTENPKPTQGGICASGCSCTLAYTSVGDIPAVLVASIALSQAAFLLAPEPMTLFVPFSVAIELPHAVDSRGPPVKPHRLLPFGLRAPPAS